MSVYFIQFFPPKLFNPSFLNAEKETLFSWAHVILMFTLTQVTARWETLRCNLSYILNVTVSTGKNSWAGKPGIVGWRILQQSASGDGLQSQSPDFWIPALPLISSVTVSKVCASVFLSKTWRHECAYLWLLWLNLLITQAFRILPNS